MLKRMAIIAVLVISLTLQGCVSLGGGLKAYVDALDGYRFLYPNGWMQVAVKEGPDIVFHDLIEETENVSVVMSALTGSKQLTDLGSPGEVGLQLVDKVLAPANSNRTAEVLAANSRTTGEKTYYDFEFLVKSPNGDRHNVSSVSISRGKLYTLNVSAPERRWQTVEEIFRKVAGSFTVD
jgi:photosystem II oxygen-evolving enhancer protein 2